MHGIIAICHIFTFLSYKSVTFHVHVYDRSMCKQWPNLAAIVVITAYYALIVALTSAIQ